METPGAATHFCKSLDKWEKDQKKTINTLSELYPELEFEYLPFPMHKIKFSIKGFKYRGEVWVGKVGDITIKHMDMIIKAIKERQ